MSRIPRDFYKLFASKYTDYYMLFLAAIHEEMSLSYSVLGLTEKECRAVMNEKIASATLLWDEDNCDEEGIFLTRSNMAAACLKHFEEWGWLRQDYDETLFNEADVKVVTRRAPTEAEMRALMFNWKVVKYTKSNAIVIGLEDRTTGIGMGQTNRIWAAQQAIEHAGDKAKGSVMASDAFFPFPDCVEECVKAGITAIVQPGGSIRDQQSIDACDEAGIAMIFVGQRHFRH